MRFKHTGEKIDHSFAFAVDSGYQAIKQYDILMVLCNQECSLQVYYTVLFYIVYV